MENNDHDHLRIAIKCTQKGDRIIIITARSELRKVLFFGAVSLWVFWLCMKYLGNRWTNLRQIHMEDVFGPSLGRIWRSWSKIKVTMDKNDIFLPFGGLRAVYVC